jgi:hypothetical protein
MMEQYEQLVFEGMKSLNKEEKKKLFKDVELILGNYYKLKVRLESLLLKKQTMFKQDESLENEIQNVITFVERVERALKACSERQRRILVIKCITSEDVKDKEVRGELSISGNGTWRREKTDAYFNFASTFGILI